MAEGLAAIGGAVWYTVFYIGVASAVVIGAMNAHSAALNAPNGATRNNDANNALSNSCDAQAPLPLVYGQCRVGINRVYAGTSGVNAGVMNIIGSLCEGEINGIVEKDGYGQVFINDTLWTKYITAGGAPYDLVSYVFKSGASNQALCTEMAAQIPAWDLTMRYTAYIYVALVFNQDYFQSIPSTITVEIEGLKVYDPATDTTAYSRNPALIARDFITRSSRRGGMGIAEARIDDDSVIDAAAYCTAKGWTCDLVLKDDQPAIDNLRQILDTFRGALVYSDSKFKIRYRDTYYESVVMNLTEDDVAEQDKSTLRILQPDIFQTPNAVDMKFTNPDKGYQVDDYVLADSQAIAADGDYREQEISLLGVTSSANIQKMANYFLERLRLNKTASLSMGHRGKALEPMDLITLTHTRPGWTQKLFRVTDAVTQYESNVSLQLEEEFDSFYDDTYDLASHSFHDTNLPDPSATVPGVGNVTAAEENYSFRGRTQTRWKIEWDKPAAAVYPWWDHVDVYLAVEQPDGTMGDYKYMTSAAAESYMVDPVNEGVFYMVKLISVSIWGTKQPDADAYVVSTRIAGKSVTVPDSLASMTALASGDTISIIATQLSDPDIEGYEVRIGSVWESGTLIGFNETPNLRFTAMKPGTHTFWMNSKGFNGYYGETPVTTEATVYAPIGYVTTGAGYHTWTYDAFSGVDAFYTEPVAPNKLRCVHDDYYISGDWTSAEYDLGSVKQVRVWGAFSASVSGGIDTWEDVFGAAGVTWDGIITTSTKWVDLLAPGNQGRFEVRIRWGDTSGDLGAWVNHFEFIAMDITARYIQIMVLIWDVAYSSYLTVDGLDMVAAERS